TKAGHPIIIAISRLLKEKTSIYHPSFFLLPNKNLISYTVFHSLVLLLFKTASKILSTICPSSKIAKSTLHPVGYKNL
ncbi:MAG TPA: hypothetical protein PLP05_08375, partial [Sedimentisphaerales bacterium]|nr:hypothetical protein [Sedimentisphaerales bacterium]